MLKLSTLLATVCLFSGPVMAADKIGEPAGQGNPSSNLDCPKDMSNPGCDRAPTEPPPTELWLLEVFKKSNNNFCYSTKAPLKLSDAKPSTRRKESLSLSFRKSTSKIEHQWPFGQPTIEIPTENLKAPPGTDYLLRIDGIPSITLHEVPENLVPKNLPPPDSKMEEWMRPQGCVLQAEYLAQHPKGK